MQLVSDSALQEARSMIMVSNGLHLVLLFDVLDDQRMEAAGRMIWEEAKSSDGLFVIGSSGIEYALSACWRSEGMLASVDKAENKAVNAVTEVVAEVDQLLVVSGSCSPITDGQIKRAIAAGFVGVRAPMNQLLVNGHRLGDWFAPGWTDYNTRVQYQTYDVTKLLLEGDNAVGAIVGDGWYAGTVGMMGKGIYGEQPFFLLQLNIEYEDGSRESVVTDSSWEAPDIQSDYAGKIVASVEPPIRIMKTIKPVDMKKTAAGTYIYDMGQNMVGWTEVNVQGERGIKVTLSHAEMLNPDGTLYLENLRKAVQQNHYILKGEGQERYEPHFTFQGFRYVELIGYQVNLIWIRLLARWCIRIHRKPAA